MKKTIWGLLLTWTLCMLLSAASADTVIVNGVDLVNDADHTVACGNGSAVYNPNTRELLLTDADITTPSPEGRKAGIYFNGFTNPVTIRLAGKNNILLTDQSYENNGIWNDASCDLIIDGDGSLNVNTYNDNAPFGIWNKKGNLSVGGVELQFSLADGSSSNGFLVDSKGIELQGTKFAAAGYMQGLFAGNILNIKMQSDLDITTIENALYADGAIRIENSKVKANGADTAAICGWGNIDIIDSNVSAQSKWDNGLYCYGKVTVAGGEVNITSEETDGFRANGGILVKEDAFVNAQGAGAGIYTNEILEVESGKVIAKGGNYAVLARRISQNSQGNRPKENAKAIVLGEGLTEKTGAQIATEDWNYTEVWDDWDWEWYDKWMSQSYFVDAENNKMKEVTILKGIAENETVVMNELPQTGDNSSFALWTLLLGACCTALVMKRRMV